MDTPPVIEVLAKTEACAKLTPAELAEIASAGAVKTAWSGDELMAEGSSGDSMLLLLDGQVAVSKSDAAGRVRELARLGPGTLLGEIALIDGMPRSATVTATEPVRYFTIERAAFGSMLGDGHRGAVKMLVAIARVLARRQAATNDRLVKALVDLSQRGGAESEDAFLKDLVIEVEC